MRRMVIFLLVSFAALEALADTGVAADTVTWRRWDGPTLGLQAATGAGGAIAGLAGGAAIGFGLAWGLSGGSLRPDQRAAAGTLAALFGVLGAVVGLPYGVQWGGERRGGNGSFWAALGGELLGGAIGSSIASTAFPAEDGKLSSGQYAGSAVLTLGLMLVGAEVAYHLTADD